MDAISALDLSQDVMSSALAGDLGPLNDWGNSVTAMVDDLEPAVKDAQAGAPTDEVEAAIGTYIKALDIIDQMGSAAADADDVMTFASELDGIGSAMNDLSVDIDAADTTVSDAVTKYCK